MTQLKANVIYLMGTMSPSELAQKSGAQQPNIFRIVQGEVLEPRDSTIQPLANYWGVSISDLKYKDLTDGSIVCNTAVAIGKADEIEIQQYADGGSMGNGIVLKDQPGSIKAWSVTPEWVNKNIKNHTGISNLCIVTGFGNSMQPLYNPGDPLIIDRGIKSVDSDATYFFRVGNEGFIKLLQRIPGEGIRVISKNKDFEAWTIKPDMDFEIFGQVLKAWCGTDV